MRAQGPTQPIPAGSAKPLSAEDREILAMLELLETLDLLDAWDPDGALLLPDLDEADPR